MTTIPEGWQLVPKKLTNEMFRAMYSPTTAQSPWEATLAAAPAPPGDDREEDAELMDAYASACVARERLTAEVFSLRATNARMREALGRLLSIMGEGTSRGRAIDLIPKAEFERARAALAQEQP